MRVPGGEKQGWWDWSITGFHVAAGTALSGSHKWEVFLRTVEETTGTISNVAVYTINSGSSAVWRLGTATAINALLHNGTNKVVLALRLLKTGTPGNLYVYPTVTYRIKAT